jgi:Na+-transporting NADH:ubiquinone oxidoreductase subunit NqrB
MTGGVSSQESGSKSQAPVPQPSVRACASSDRFSHIKPYLAPVLITVILTVGELSYGILQSYLFTALAIASSILLEIALCLIVTGRLPHLASSYITGISVGILVRSPVAWPYVLASLLSISSKYALRCRGRHLWNPSNFGVSVLFYLVPASAVPLSLEWGNVVWAPLVIFCLGAIILYSLGRLHITMTYVAAFATLSMLRGWLTGRPLASELGLLTHPSYLLFMFFMITDPKTTTRTRARQCLVAIVVALVETALRLTEELHAAYYALFIVAPVSNLIEIWFDKGSHTAPLNGLSRKDHNI